MSLKSKIEAVIYASEEPVTLAQLAVVLAGEAQAELEEFAARQNELPLRTEDSTEAEREQSELQSDVSPSAEEIRPEDSEENDSSPLAEVQPQDDTEFPTTVPQGDAPAEPSESSTDGSQIDPEAEKRVTRERDRAIREHIRRTVDALMREYVESDRGIEIREVAGGFRMATKPEYHDAVRGFVRSLKPALKLSLQALETLAVVAYKQPVTAAEISEIRGVDSAGVLGGLLTRKLIQTAGRKQVIGRPMLYKTTKEFLVRFGLKDVQELPSMEEFERMASELNEQEDLPMDATDSVIERTNARGDAEHIRETNEAAPLEETEGSPKAEAVPNAPTANDGSASKQSVDETREHVLSQNGEAQS